MSFTYFARLVPLAAEMVLDSALRQYRIDRLRQMIDEALDTGNRSLFMKLSEEFKVIVHE